MKNRIIAAIVAPVLMYLAGAFVYVDFNIDEWDGLGRGVVAFVSLASITVSLFAPTEEEANRR